MALIQCPDCGSQVSDAAPACPKCGRPIAPPVPVTVNVAQPPPQKAAKSASKNGGCAAVVLVAIVGFIVWAANQDGGTTRNSNSSASAPAAEAPKPVYETTSMKLFQDYERNEVAADNAMKGSVVRVTGRIEAIDKDFTDDVIVNLQTPNQFMPARMQMIDSEKAAAAGLSKGQSVEIECERMARVVGSPSGRECHFVR